MTATGDDRQPLDTTLPGLDEAVVNTTERAADHAAQIADERPEFDDGAFEVVDAYVFGSVAAGEATPGVSDLDVCLCVPPWESPGDVTHPAGYRPVVDEIMMRLRNESEDLLPDSILSRGVSEIDVWIGEPAYNADHLDTSVIRPIYFPDTDVRLSPDEAADRIREYIAD